MIIQDILSFRNIYFHLFLLILFSITVTILIGNFERTAEKENLETLEIIDNLNRTDIELSSLLSKRMSVINYDQINFYEREFYKYSEELEQNSLDKNMNERNGIYIKIRGNIDKKLKLFEKFKSYNSIIINYISYFYNTYEELEQWKIDHSLQMEIDKLLFSTLQDFVTLKREVKSINRFKKLNTILKKFPDHLYMRNKTNELLTRIKKMKEFTTIFKNITEEIQKISLQKDVEDYRKIIYKDISDYQEIYRYILSSSISTIAILMFLTFNWRNSESKKD